MTKAPNAFRTTRAAFKVAASIAAFAIAVISVVAQSPFPTDQERFLWKDLGPWSPVLHNSPSTDPASFEETGELDELTGDPILVSVGTYEEQFELLENGECTFSHLGDVNADGPQTRQCKAADGVMAIPPPPGALLDPVALAVDGERVYVVDDFNNRLQVFDFFGNVIPLTTPIGTGVVGIGPDPNHGGEMLSEPNGVAVDAAHQIVVSDAGNARIAVFTTGGSFVFDNGLVDGVAGAFKPTSLALTPGTTLLAPGSPLPVDGHENDRLVVTDHSHCQVQIYDRRFQLIRSLPEELPAVSMHDACKDPPPPGSLIVGGEFSTVTGAAVDAAGHIYISDHAQSLVQVFDRNGDHLGWIGRPGMTVAPSTLDGPVGVMIDHLGRLGVIDGGHSRAAFYTVDFSTGSPVATFEFQLDTTVAVSDFAMGLAEQIGPAPLDPKGRLLATDPFGRQVIRFELPELAIVNAVASNGVGSFDVLVPRQKAEAVMGTVVSVVPVEAGVTIDTPPTPTDPKDIGPGEYVSYTFTYTSTVPEATFVINASGDGGDTAADDVNAVSRANCATCGATHAVYEDPVAGSPVPAVLEGLNGDWYDREVFVRITPTAAEPVESIFWFFEGQAALLYGGAIQESAVEGGFVDATGVRVAGQSSLTYWVVTPDGSVGPRVTVPLWIDLESPEVHFADWTAFTDVDTQGNGWYNETVATVTGSYNVTDQHAGSESDSQAEPTPDGSVTFTDEGRGQQTTFDVADYVGHVSQINTGSASGGRLVNIDRTPPNFVFVPNLTVAATGQDEDGLYADVHQSEFFATATDPLLADGSAGSGEVAVTAAGTQRFYFGPNDFTFTATDAAGNSATAVGHVTVGNVEASISALNSSVTYGGPMTVSAQVSPSFATGTVTFTFGPDDLYSVSDTTLEDGFATVLIPSVLANVGVHTMQVSYGGSAEVEPVSTTATVTVGPRAVTVSTIGLGKVYGQADPLVLVPSVMSGALFGGDTFSGSLVRAPGSNVGAYAIMQGTLALSSNYALTYVGANFTIIPVAITVTADAKSKPITTADPPLTYQVTSGAVVSGDSFSGALTRVAGEAAGPYAILQGTLTLGPNYAITYVGALLQITGSVITVTADHRTKIYGYGDPELTYSFTGVLPLGVEFSGSLDRQGGEAKGNYQIGQGTLSLPPGFVLIYHSASFSIEARNATVTAGGGTKVFGTADPAITVSSSGFLPADEDDIVLSASRAGAEDAGTYSTLAAATGDILSNYNVGLVSGTFTITPAQVTVSAVAAGSTYGLGDPAFTFAYGPLPGGMTAADVDAPPTCTVAGAHTAAGSYPITCSGGADNNLTFAYTPATFTVAPKAATITINPKTKLFGAALPIFDAAVTGVLAGDTLAYTLTTTANVLSPIGTYPITAQLGANPNYAITVIDSTLTIGIANIILTVTPQSMVYGGAVPTLGATVSGVPIGAVVNYSLSTTATSLSPVGSYPIHVTLGSNPNVLIEIVPATVTIGPRPITVTAQNTGKVFGTTDPPLISLVTSGSVVNGDPFSGSLLRVAGEAVGSYDILQNTLTLGANYQITYVKGTFTITPANQTCTLAGFTTYTQGGWGATPNGNNPAMLLQNNFAAVYPGGSVKVGGTKKLTFTSSTAIKNFLPAGGTPGVLTANATNPTTSSAGVFAGQVLALQLNVDFSNAGITKPGLGALLFYDYPVSDVLAFANEVLGGNTSILQGFGLTVAELSAIIAAINENFDNGTSDDGLLTCPEGPANCGPTTMAFAGSSATSGAAGNIRTFSAGGVSVKASAFSRAKSNGAWTTAFLGVYDGNLGVTDGSEGSGGNNTHKLDNIGDRLNYLLFEFSQPVVVTQAYLTYLGVDGDATVWVGSHTDPFNDHLMLSDLLLSGLGAPQSNTSTSIANRWATFNGTGMTANVLVIAADVNDSTPEDAFKVAKLQFTCAVAVNHSPSVTASSKSSNEGTSASVQIVASDPDDDALIYAASGLPPGLSINPATGLITGSLSYSSAGTYNVTVTVTDDGGLSASATFVWTVVNVTPNTPPTVAAANRTNAEGNTVSVQITGSDADGNTLTYTSSGLPPGLSMSSTGLITGTLGNSSAGTYSVTVTVKDPSNATGAATFVWTVTNTNRAPNAVNDSANTVKNKAKRIAVLANDTDPDGNALTIPSFTQPSSSKGSVVKNTNGTFTFTPKQNYTGTATFTYTVSDGHGGTDTATVTVTIQKSHSGGDGCDDHD